jgi:hypothetical protein
VTVDLDDASHGALVEAAEAIAAELAARTAPESPTVCLEEAEILGRAIDRSEAAMASLVRRVDAAGEARRWGFTCTTAWLRARLGMRGGRAGDRVVVARQLPRLSRIAKLLASGDLSYGYATAICQAVTRLDDTDATTGEEILLELADAGGTVKDVAKAGDRIRDLVAERDGREAPPADSKRGFERSWAEQSRSLDGSSWVKMWLNAEDTAVFSQALEPLAKPVGAGDDRDHGHRLADALISVLARGHRTTGATVIIDLETLQGSDKPARLPGDGVIPARRARQIALNAGVNALLLGSDGRPLYLGRTVRFASPAQRRVLQTLYDTCVVDGCEIPAWLCEIHHLGGGWKLDVPTDIDKLVPACGWHNRWIEDNPQRVEEHRDRRGRVTIRCLPPWRVRPPHNEPGQSDPTSRGP